MQIKIGVTTPAEPYKTRDGYRELIEALQVPGQWIRIPLSEVSGKDNNAKRVSIRQMAIGDGFRVSTRTDAQYMYLCRRAPAQKAG
jgi:hypothetical protein